MNRKEEIKQAISLVKSHVRFDKDDTVNVFELTIRALGGLVSAHILLTRNPDIVENYKDEFLEAAVDLGDRLLQAYNYADTIPNGAINLKTVNPYVN